MIIWLNGTFGAGKTTTARQLAGRLANARHFDPELVGELLMTALDDHEFKDFQDLPPWRELVPVFTEKIADFTGQHLIAVQTVLREDYWRELTRAFGRTPLDIFHVLLHVDSDVLAERIKADEVDFRACQWRLDHIGEAGEGPRRTHPGGAHAGGADRPHHGQPDRVRGQGHRLSSSGLIAVVVMPGRWPGRR